MNHKRTAALIPELSLQQGFLTAIAASLCLSILQVLVQLISSS